MRKTADYADKQPVALAPFSRELLPQPLWSCHADRQIIIIFRESEISDHKAAAASVRDQRERKRLVAVCVVCGISKHTQSQQETAKNCHAKHRLTTQLILSKTYNPTTVGFNTGIFEREFSFRVFFSTHPESNVIPLRMAVKKEKLFEFERTRVELIISSLQCKKLCMVSAFDDSSAFEH